MQRNLRKVLRTVANYDPDYYDMHSDPHERFFAKLYVERILNHARENGIHPPATFLEAGCQAGRLIVPFAKAGYRVTGIDTSGFALRRAKRHLKAEGLEAELVRKNILDYVRKGEGRTFDIILCAEVIYMIPEYREVIEGFASMLNPGGMLCISHRSQAYYLIRALQCKDLGTATDAIAREEGPLGNSDYFNWQTPEALYDLYAGLNLDVDAIYPIDRFSWLTALNPADLSEPEQNALLALERNTPQNMDALGRYLLVIATR